MITLSLSERTFIRNHITDDVRALLLKSQPPGLDIRKLAAQISARQKAREKIPRWYAEDTLVFPPALSVEQASSEQTAAYKTSLVSGKCLFDLTGGMGIDTWAFAQRMEQVVYIERNDELAELAAHNMAQLAVNNVTVQTGDGLLLFKTWPKTDEMVDWVYLDPHRRDSKGGKVVGFNECEPDLSQPGILADLLKKTKRILVKASPLLDIDLAVQQLMGAVEMIHIVAVQGEVKEVLFILGNQSISKESLEINTVNLNQNVPVRFSFRWHEERVASIDYGNPEMFIYEPNAAVLKAGAFRLVASRYGLTKLAPNSHLYTNNEIRPDFPGRIFSVLDVIKPDAKALKQLLPELKANLTVRNFPQTVADLRKKLSLREGGAIYILATTLLNGDKRLLITKKVDPIHS